MFEMFQNEDEGTQVHGEDAMAQGSSAGGAGAAVQFEDTLTLALASCEGDASAKVVFGALWRLAMYLRHWQGGSDVHWIKSASACQRSSSKMTWWKCLGRISFGYVWDCLGSVRL